jgi:hypothetical protein
MFKEKSLIYALLEMQIEQFQNRGKHCFFYFKNNEYGNYLDGVTGKIRTIYPKNYRKHVQDELN